MFQFGRMNGYLTILLIVLGIIPLAVTFFAVPQMPDSVAMAFNASGEATRYASRYQLFLVPAVAFLLSIATCIMARRQAKAAAQESSIAAELTYRRSIRSAAVIAVLLNACTVYMLFTAYTGTGFSLPF